MHFLDKKSMQSQPSATLFRSFSPTSRLQVVKRCTPRSRHYADINHGKVYGHVMGVLFRLRNVTIAGYFYYLILTKLLHVSVVRPSSSNILTSLKITFEVKLPSACSFIADGLAFCCRCSHYMFRPTWTSSGV
jgi:hypothetical protein